MGPAAAGVLAWSLLQPAWAAASGRAGRRAGQCGSWPPVPSSPWCRRPIPKDRAGTRPGGTSGLAQRPRADSRSAGPLAAGAGLGETRADPPVHSLRTALGSDRPWAVQRRAPRTYTPERAPRVGQCGCERHESLGWQTGWTACPDATLAYGRGGCTLTREGTPCTSRQGRRRRRGRAAGLQPIGAAALGHPPHCGHVGCAALHSLRQVAPGCCLLQRVATGSCNGLWSVATGCHAVQQVVTRCKQIVHAAL